MTFLISPHANMAVNTEHQQEEPYVFWLFDWGDRPIGSTLRLVPNYARCDITKEQIAIYGENQPLMIRLSDLHEYKEIRVYDNGSTSNLKLGFHNKALAKNNKRSKKLQEIFLLPADALRHQRLYLELLNMYDVIHAYKSGQEPTLDKNPYHRMLKYHGQTHRLTEQTWDPTLHPSHHSPVPTVGGILTNLVLTIIGGGVLGAAIVAIIYYIVTTFF